MEDHGLIKFWLMMIYFKVFVFYLLPQQQKHGYQLYLLFYLNFSYNIHGLQWELINNQKIIIIDGGLFIFNYSFSLDLFVC